MYGIFAYIWLMFMENVGKCTSPMDPMGIEDDTKFDTMFVLSQSSSCVFFLNPAHLLMGVEPQKLGMKKS